MPAPNLGLVAAAGPLAMQNEIAKMIMERETARQLALKEQGEAFDRRLKLGELQQKMLHEGNLDENARRTLEFNLKQMWPSEIAGRSALAAHYNREPEEAAKTRAFQGEEADRRTAAAAVAADTAAKSRLTLEGEQQKGRLALAAAQHGYRMSEQAAAQAAKGTGGDESDPKEAARRLMVSSTAD